MKIFEFSTNVVDNVLQELQKAKEFIYIAVFQIHKKELFELLEKKLNEGVEVAIFTLPYDSINADVRQTVSELYEKVKNKGAKLYTCKWNVGDTAQTTAAIGHWYSYHGKFIVTDKTAIALSANFLQESELDACLIFENEVPRIKEFRSRFNELKELFVDDNKNGRDIKSKILNSKVNGSKNVLELPRIIETDIHTNSWIMHYPNDILNKYPRIEDRLYISPFDIKAREICMDIVGRAKRFVYLATESFTDVDFAEFLEKTKANNKLDIRILVGGVTSMDYSDRVKDMIKKLLSFEIKIKKAVENLHAKLIITDNSLIVGSVNLNKINLGFRIGKDFWRGNTETLTLTTDRDILKVAKGIYEKVFKNGKDITFDLERKLSKEIGLIFNRIYEVSSNKEAKDLLARYILMEELKVKAKVFKICQFSVKLMKKFKKRSVNVEILVHGLIVYWLSERKMTEDELQEKINYLTASFKANSLLVKLFSENIIEKEGNFYKLDINSLL
jgi:phosphatidylserine/phosphatidylglycerophosphate/cardiolipin synthase-like enzyme